ncbi:MAG TPA: dihydroorotase [bacterium]
MSSLLISHCRLIDPKTKFDGTTDILVQGNKISRIDDHITARDAQVIDAQGMIAVPGLIDLHCHLRDPGRPDEETIESGCSAALSGGFTSICCMPNTDPPIDNEGIVNYVLREAQRVGLCRVFVIAAITKKREGREISEFGELVRAGVKAFSDDGDSVYDAGVLRHALEYSKTFGVPIFEHCLDQDLSHGGLMNESIISTRLGLAGSPSIAEDIMVARDLILAHFTGARLHICHVSSKGAVGLIRRAKKEGIKVTAETCPQYFTFSDTLLETYDTNYKVNPPIRTEDDRQAVIAGLKDGTIDVIATDHAPHTQAEKELEFASVPFGMTGLETALSMTITELITKENFTWIDVLQKMTINPARVIGEDLGVIKPGAMADITVIEPSKRWRLTEERIRSRSRNTPYLNRELTGCPAYVIINGEIKYRGGA